LYNAIVRKVSFQRLILLLSHAMFARIMSDLSQLEPSTDIPRLKRQYLPGVLPGFGEKSMLQQKCAGLPVCA
jgi:hypothetical protein